MCSLIILRRPEADFPVLIAANRDEMSGRPWRPPARHWDDRPHVIGGFDEVAGGTWLGLNEDGVVAAVLNRQGTLGPEPGKRSRGELALESLDHADAAEAAEALSALDVAAWRPFNLIVADNRDAFCLIHDGSGRLRLVALPAGLIMVTHADPNDTRDPRIRLYRPRFEQAPVPNPNTGDWAAWQALLASREHEPGGDARGALNIETPSGFGTTSSALIALPSAALPEAEPVWLFAAGRPDEAPWQKVPLA